jgi:cAMP phosphodiesterase
MVAQEVDETEVRISNSHEEDLGRFIWPAIALEGTQNDPKVLLTQCSYPRYKSQAHVSGELVPRNRPI